MDIYEPAEDSYLLQKFVGQHAYGRVLDLGTGSGIQALSALESPRVREVLAVDVNKKAVEELKEKTKNNKKINVIRSNLFENVAGKFNTIIFNPPYLPQDKGIEDAALYGGKHGWEVSEKFFSQASKHLIADGQILFLFSTLTNKEKIEEIIAHHLFEFEELGNEKIAFETLYVYKITKTKLLRELEGKLIENIRYLTHGKRGMIFVGEQDKSKLVKSHFPSKKSRREVAIKVQREDVAAQNRINNEANWLKELNKKSIGPKLLFSGENYMVYEFVEGEFILDWLRGEKTTTKDVVFVLKDLLNQCYIMDKLHVSKEEMHHPIKHVVITKHKNPVLLDFERCHKTNKPQNVTQCIEFISRMTNDLAKKDILVNKKELIELAKGYKETYSKNMVDDIVGMLGGMK